MTTKQIILRKFPVISATALLILGSISDVGAEDQLDWWALDSEVGNRLLTGEKNLVEWAGELAESEPKTSRDALMKFNVCLRAALDDKACDAVRTLWLLGPEKVDNSLLTSSYHAATDQYLAWDVAQTIVEIFAPRIHDITLENRLIKHFRVPDNPQRWSDDAFVAWLDARVESVRRFDREQEAGEVTNAVPSVLDHWRVRPIQYWTRLRLRYLAEMGRAGVELDRMAALVRANPTESGIAVEYLWSLRELRGHPENARHSQLDWLPGICQPVRATDMEHLASLLVNLEQYKAAEAFFLRAIHTKITDEEISQLAMMCQAVLSQQTHRLLFEIRLREELATCLLKLGETERSQQVMVEAADMRKKHNLSANSYLAGAVQAASGARVIEGRIREEEKTHKDHPEYWFKRAEYYRGRNETAQEEEALRRGLALSPLDLPVTGKGPMQMRPRFLSNLTQLLVRDKRPDVAVGLLVSELKEAPVNAASSESAARLLSSDLTKYIKPDEPVLWSWLSRRNKWEYIEERLLMRMLEATPEAPSDHFARAETLAMCDGADATRAATLGWIFNRIGEARRSVTLLEHALKFSTHDDLKQRAAFALLESHLDLNDWRAAESIFGLAEKRLGPGEDTEWLGRVALIAAEKGASKDAMRIFRKVANCNLRPYQLVTDLSKHGLSNDLRRFYAEVRTHLPTAKLEGFPE